MSSTPLQLLRQFRARASLGRKLTRRSRRLGADLDGVTVRQRKEPGPLHRVRIERSGRRIRATFDFEGLANDVFSSGVALLRLPTHLAFFSRADRALEAISVDLSDGEECGPGIVGFCSMHPDAVLVPDEEFCHSRGYEDFRHADFDPAANWWERRDAVLWRGMASGVHRAISGPDMAAANDALVPRVRLCLMLRDVAGVDAKIVAVPPGRGTAEDLRCLSAAGILAERTEPREWLGYRYAIDIDGNSNAWSNFFTRLLIGNCVIKVGSPAGYRQWYYDRIEPWVHYVPVRPDMGDLLETIDWCRSHPEECFAIARAGRELALSMTFESETRAAVARLSALAEGAR